MNPIAELENIVGARNVSTIDLDAYAQDRGRGAIARPVGTVKAHTAGEIVQIVKWARASATPLVPVSSGGPHLRGNSTPSSGGAMIVDLSEMKKVLHVDRTNRVALFEPGVTFGELAAAVNENGLRLNMPLLPRAHKSVAGSLLEREPVQMPVYHWDGADPLACTEIVFGTGEVFRTGAAAGSGSIEEQWAAGGAQKEAAGPSASSWYRLIQGSQGTMGIVSWVSARCELMPRQEAPFFAASDSLASLLSVVHWLVRLRLANECFILNARDFALAAAEVEGGEAVPTKMGPSAWVLFFNIAAYDYFPEERIAGQVEDMTALLRRNGMEAVKEMGGVSAEQFLRRVKLPATDPYWKLRPRGACQDIFFITVLERLPNLVAEMSEIAAAGGYPPSDIGTYIQPIVQGANCHCEFSLFHDPNDPVEVLRAKKIIGQATHVLSNKGAFFSRPYGENARWIMNRDAATVEALKKIKTLVDPENIMNPGKLCF